MCESACKDCEKTVTRRRGGGRSALRHARAHTQCEIHLTNWIAIIFYFLIGHCKDGCVMDEGEDAGACMVGHCYPFCWPNPNKQSAKQTSSAVCGGEKKMCMSVCVYRYLYVSRYSNVRALRVLLAVSFLLLSARSHCFCVL